MSQYPNNPQKQIAGGQKYQQQVKMHSQPESFLEQHVAGNKQNLISQLQNNQQQSMLYRLHQQQTNPDDQQDFEGQRIKTQQMVSSKAKGLSPSKPNQRLSLKVNTNQQMGNTVRGSNQLSTKSTQNTYNQNRMMKQSVQLDYIQPQNLASPQNQSSSFQAPPLSHMATHNIKVQNDQNNFQRLGSQERLHKAAQKSGFIQYKSNSKSNGNAKRQYNVNNMNVGKKQSGMSTGGQSFVQQYLQTSNSGNNLNYVTEGHASQISGSNIQPNIIQGVGPHLVSKSPNQMPIQHPHFIKMKSKTNANPTRKNSPRFSGKYSVSQAKDPLRQSVNNKVHSKTGKKIGQQSTSSNMNSQPTSQIQVRTQVFSQPSSPIKGDPLSMESGNISQGQHIVNYSSSLVDQQQLQGYQSQMKKQVINQNMNINTNLEPNDFRGNGKSKFSPQANKLTGSGISISEMNQGTTPGTSQSTYQKNMKQNNNPNQAMRQSMNKNNTDELNDADKNRMKGHSQNNLYQSIQGPASSKNKTSSSNNNNQNKNSQRIQSGNINKNQQQQNFQNNIRRLNSPPVNLITNTNSQYSSQLDQQQKKQLNMVVSKKMGNVASGKSRRENRNQMMKSNLNQNILDSKSVVGSMGSLGSLQPFMGVDDGTQNWQDQAGENIHYGNKTAGELNSGQQNNIHYSQLQQIHLNNVNPMFFATGDAVPSTHQMGGTIGSNQLMTMGGTVSASRYPEQVDQSPLVAPLQTQNSQGTINYVNNKSSQQSTYQGQYEYESQSKQQPVQMKTSMIQMRKINPISKTQTNGSQNTSVDRKKSNSLGLSMQQQQIQQHQQQIHQVNQNLKMSGINYKMMNNKNYKDHRIIQGKPTAQTAKVSYNNSPTNRSKLGGSIRDNMSIQNANQSKRQMQLGKQQPIGQPMGDIPLISQYFSFKQGPSHKDGIEMGQNFQTEGQVRYNDTRGNDAVGKKKHHQFAQSVLIAENQQQSKVLKNKNQYKTIYQLDQKKLISDDSAELREHPSIEGEPIASAGISAVQYLANGKVKMKMMSQTNSPPAYQFSSNQMANLNTQSQRQSTQNSANGSQINNHPSQMNQRSGGVAQAVGGERRHDSGNQSGNNFQNGSYKNGKSSSLSNNRQSVKGSQKNLKDEHGQQQLNQYFKQQKHKFSYGNKYNKFAQIDSPKEGSIERVRHFDIVQQEQEINQMNKQLGNVVEFNENNESPEIQTPTTPKNTEEQLLDFLVNMKQDCEVALAIGDIYSLKSPNDINGKLKQLMKKQQYVLCPGNIGSKQNKQWLDSLSKQKLIAVKGDLDSEGLNLNETIVVKFGKIKVGMINGYQLQPNCDHQSLLEVLKQLDCDVLIHGHTKEFGVHQVDNKILINPGSATGEYQQLFDNLSPSIVLLAIQEDNMMIFQCQIHGEYGEDLKIQRTDINFNKEKIQRKSDLTFFNSCVIKAQKEDESSASNQKSSNKTTQYIINNLEKTDRANLSPRSKEVWLIKQLNKDCFSRYNKPPKTQLELYKIGKMLGKGAFGKVNLGLHRLTRKLVAIKSINMDFMKEESQKKKIMNEIDILKSLRHPNNIKLLETFQTDKHHMIVMELCPGGDLLNYVRKRRKLSEKYAKFVFRQIMEGIAYLHKQKVSHRDIKLDNILLDGHGNIKIGDFGVSRQIETNEILFEQCGTPAYIAPEIVKDMGYKGFPVDIWSAGICLYAMIYGNVPFKANQIGDLNTVEQLNQEIEYKKDVVSQPAIDLMKMMLQKVPKQRATAEQVLQHEWLNDDFNKQIDIFDEQELELIRKEFTYVVQKKKLKEFKEMKEKAAQDGEMVNLASRMPNDLNTEFTECSIQTHENSLLKNDSSRSVILCPFNTQTGDKTADKIIKQSEGLMMDKDIMIRFHHRVRELDRNYEKLNNQDFDNGVYHKYAYKQKAQIKKDQENAAIKEEEIKQSDVQMNNLVTAADATDTSRQKKRENAENTFHNYYVKINNTIIEDTVKMGFPMWYVQKCLKENANNHCTTTYYLLCMDQNF